MTILFFLSPPKSNYEKYKNLIGITFKKSRFNATPEARKFFEISRLTNLTRLEVPDHVFDWPFPEQWLGLSTLTNLQCISIVEKHNSGILCYYITYRT
jgi:hypothetical protein